MKLFGTQGTRVAKKPQKRKKKSRVLKHMKSLGFTNRLAVYILLFLAAGLAGGFYLALKSIAYGYTGALMCWTVVFTPIGTAVSIAISRVVEKNRDENTSASGDGITYASAMAKGFVQEEENDEGETSPSI